MQLYPYNPYTENIIIPQLALQYPLQNYLLLTQWIQMLNYRSKNYYKNVDGITEVED